MTDNEGINKKAFVKTIKTLCGTTLPLMSLSTFAGVFGDHLSLGEAISKSVVPCMVSTCIICASEILNQDT